MATFVGTPARSPNNDLYDRIHTIPANLDLGNLVSQVDTSVYIWNAYRTNAILTGVTSSGTDGVAFIDMPTTPYVFRPLKMIRTTLRAVPQGGEFINADWSLDFNTGDNLIFSVTGNRVKVFPFAPNWGEQYLESLSWQTDIITAYDGSEQRRSITAVPRRTFEFSFMTKGKASSRLESLLWAWQNKKFVLPIWTDVTKLDVSALEGDEVIACDTRKLGIKLGSYVVLHETHLKVEVLPVKSFTLNSITLDSPLVNNWGAGTRVMIGALAYMPSAVQLQRYTSDVQTGRVMFWTNPAETDPNLPNIAPVVTYEGREVLLRRFNWGSAIDNVFTRDFDLIDFGYGAIDTYTKAKYTKIERPLAFLLKGRDDIHWFRGFLARRIGRLKSFWVPSWHDDMYPAAETPAGQGYLRIEGVDFAERVGVDPARSRIMVKLKNGTRYYRRILGMLVETGVTRLNLETTFPVAVGPDNIESIQLLLLCRLAADKIDIPWQTGTVANPTVRVLSVNQ